MIKIYLIHGWGGNSEGEWFNLLKREFSKDNIEVKALNMPESDNPKIETWIKYLKKNIKDVDKNTFFIGHSIECQTILRFLEKLPQDTKIGGAIFVAGWVYFKEDSF